MIFSVFFFLQSPLEALAHSKINSNSLGCSTKMLVSTFIMTQVLIFASLSLTNYFRDLPGKVMNQRKLQLT
jgi:hypothetical protein